ncbi:MAG: hypothetical protein IKK21_04930, partial [Clostridia bacterium]|nr:hypothetical protein [Clostridia bacterium]
MRKCISLLLAVMMALLPACSLAEGQQFELSFSYDAETFARVLDEVLALTAQMNGEDALEIIPGMEVREMAEMMTKIINCSSFTAYTQENGVKLVFSMQDKEVISAFVTWDEQEIAATTSILPGVKLSVPLGEVDVVQDTMDALAAVDWAALANGMANRVFRWASSLRGNGTLGTFSGDAYDGGVKRVEYALTDADVAALLESLLLGLEGDAAAMTLLGTLFGEELVTQRIRSFREYSNQVVLNSRYHYTVSMVYDENDA